MVDRRIPDEDLGPMWLRDYGSIEADLRGMQDYANALRDELERNYLPHRDQVNVDMKAPAAAPASQFVELVELLTAQQRSQVTTASLLTAHGDATYTFSAAAKTISSSYGDSDGLAVAKAKDIESIMAPGLALSSSAGSPSAGSPSAGSSSTGSLPAGSSSAGSSAPVVAP